LSKIYAVRVMIYGNTSFMDAPWEIIIKIHRKQLRSQGFSEPIVVWLTNSDTIWALTQRG
jgi:hypothetical protein